MDSPPGRPASISVAGPTFDPEELAGRKVVALFDRAAARDFVDVYALHRTFTKTVLIDRPAEVDVGFDLTVFAEMLDHLSRYADADLELGEVDVAAVRKFFEQWAAEIRSERS